MKKKNVTIIGLSIFLFLALIIISCGQSVNNLVGVWEGSYFANQGETGMTLTVFKEGSSHKAILHFYNLPGRSNAREGKYFLDVLYIEPTKSYYLKATEWIERPSGYRATDLEGTITGNKFSGTLDGSWMTFELVKKK